jgi:ribosome biogenesis GTPase
MGKKKKVRVEFRKNRAKPPRANDVTREFAADADKAGDAVSGERVRARGELSRARTILVEDGAAGPAVSAGDMHPGRVLRMQGLHTVVELDDGRLARCGVRRLLKTLATDERGAVAAGDRVWVRLADPASRERKRPEDPPPTEREVAGLPPVAYAPGSPGVLEGLIERVDPRRGVLTRASRRREQVLVANVDQVVIVLSLVEPALKPHLIDRYLAVAESGELKPVLVLNKADAVDPAEFQPLVGAYSRLGVPTFLTSTRTGQGVPFLRERLRGRASVFAGQSGVGKTSLLNAVQPGLARRVGAVSDVNQKGKHTTTTAELVKLDTGGWVVDTPGVRQLALWNLKPEQVEGLFVEFAPFVARCRFPDCTHTHEGGCGVRGAVARGVISDRRYTSYLGLFHGGEE